MSSWYGSGANSILAVEFGQEILLKMVLILPCTEEYCMKSNQLRVTVGYALPEMSTGNIGSIDLLSHFTKVKCDSWTYFFCVVLVTQGIPATGVKRVWATSTTQNN